MPRLRPSILVLLGLAACTSGKSGDGAGDHVKVTYSDQDGDTIVDFHEGYTQAAPGDTGDSGAGGDPVALSRDSDRDGTPDYLDTDSDDDGIGDANEAGDSDPLTMPYDSDEDGLADFIDTDSDDNCIPDADEGGVDADRDGIAAYNDLDDDGDGILDSVEIGADCGLADSDGDGTPDYLDTDSDDDGIGDVWEAGTSAWQTEPRDTDGDGTPDYLDLDSDNDGFTDAEESGTTHRDEEPRDTDSDGTYDFADTDSDGDGLSDADERDIYHTLPYSDDTDHDGFTDGAEVGAGTDPTDASSVIDGVYVTVPERTAVEQDFDFTLSVKMGDVAFLLDSTCSMSGTLSGMASEFSTIVSDLSSRLPDAEYGTATFDDYPTSGYGTAGVDKPFELRQEITSDTARVQSVLRSLGIHSGNDAPESSMEALYQSLSGVGYDMNCNHAYDSNYDVKPFIASSADPFNGGGGQFRTGAYPGGGTAGGFGFRDYALPIVVYATDAQMRDSEGAYGTPVAARATLAPAMSSRRPPAWAPT